MLRFWAALTIALLALVVVSARYASPEGARLRTQHGGNYWLRAAVAALALLTSVGAPAVLDAGPAPTANGDVLLLPPPPAQLLLATPAGDANEAADHIEAIEARAAAANASRSRRSRAGAHVERARRRRKRRGARR